MKKTLLLTVIVLVFMLVAPLADSPWRTSSFHVYADDVLERLDSIKFAISKLTRKIDALEKRLEAIENVLLKAPKPNAHAKSYRSDPRQNNSIPVGPEGFVDIGAGFLMGNLSYKASLGNTTFNGEIENQSIKSYKTVIFNIKVFNKKETVIGGKDFLLHEFYIRERLPFEITIFSVDMKSIAGYEINFVKGF